MSKFVDECRKEWKRLGVPELLSNEMAADLEADLAEAEAEGVSPEEVLGNGAFDPASFAASWAMARGITGRTPDAFRTSRRRRWKIALSTAACGLAVLFGLLILAGNPRKSLVAIQTVRRSINLPALRGVAQGHLSYLIPPLPGRRVVLAYPQQTHFYSLGWTLLMVGLIGFGVTLWFWRPWSTHRRDAGIHGRV